MTFLRVAAIPEEQFEALIESEKPPTVTQLAMVAKDMVPLIQEETLKQQSPGTNQWSPQKTKGTGIEDAGGGSREAIGIAADKVGTNRTYVHQARKKNGPPYH